MPTRRVKDPVDQVVQPPEVVDALDRGFHLGRRRPEFFPALTKDRLLGVADLKRANTVPEIPTISEAEVADFKSITWFGLAAPPATPAALVEKINRDVVEILKSKDVGDMLHKMSLEAGATAPAETTRFFAEETALWSKVIKEAGIEPQ